MTRNTEFRFGLNSSWQSEPTLEGPKLCDRGKMGRGVGNYEEVGVEGPIPESCWGVTLHLIGRGKVLTSTQLLSLCSHLKRNQPQILSHTISLAGLLGAS